MADHLATDLLDEPQTKNILVYCEKRSDKREIGA
jgi:hypothetical protein